MKDLSAKTSNKPVISSTLLASTPPALLTPGTMMIRWMVGKQEAIIKNAKAETKMEI